MLPITKILCPTDFSEPSRQAMDVAGELAQHFDAELHVIHVVGPMPIMATPPPSVALNIPGYQKELEASAREALSKEVDGRLSEELATRQIVVTGLAADEIVRIARESDVGMIVIATHGRTGIGRLIFGSVAERVVRHATCPVLTIRPEEREETD
jgi:nucleotide-binding universal stress UspA family protein